MPATDPQYYQRRYKEDAAYRTAVVAATQRWQERQREADPDAYAARVARGVVQRRERYQSDAEFRERLLEAQRRRRRAAAAAGAGRGGSQGAPDSSPGRGAREGDADL